MQEVMGMRYNWGKRTGINYILTTLIFAYYRSTEQVDFWGVKDLKLALFASKLHFCFLCLDLQVPDPQLQCILCD